MDPAQRGLSKTAYNWFSRNLEISLNQSKRIKYINRLHTGCFTDYRKLPRPFHRPAPPPSRSTSSHRIDGVRTDGPDSRGRFPPLGGWDPAKAVELSAVDYRSGYPTWFVSVSLPAGTTFEYNFVGKEEEEEESGGDISFGTLCF